MSSSPEIPSAPVPHAPPRGLRLMGGEPLMAGTLMAVSAIVAAGVLYRWGEVPLVAEARRLLWHGKSGRADS